MVKVKDDVGDVLSTKSYGATNEQVMTESRAVNGKEVLWDTVTGGRIRFYMSRAKQFVSITLLTDTVPAQHHFSQHSTASTPLLFDRNV
jgi:hypothetical protein